MRKPTSGFAAFGSNIIMQSVNWYKHQVVEWLDENRPNWRSENITIERVLVALAPPRRKK